MNIEKVGKKMNNVMENISKEVIEEIRNTETKNIVIETKEDITAEQRAVIESIRKIRNPFVMVGIDYVMKDLNICKTIVYKLFQREDFPSISIGKEHKVMLLSYLIWKMSRKD